MLKSFKKAFFRALCLGVLGLLGVRDYGKEPNPKRACPFGHKELQRARFFSS
ncbi:hypothetical protein E5K95_01960 [Helicobacter pylori]|uniref:hypothetical protein n=1 Tax=Helicobacter pylori TaxID=210 RepID=UPI00039C103E|nr:hypothetical protein [Helicobacter pylori]WRC72287.1 hypothetical protein E5K95_01960 [Helicobacter pylori]